MMDLAFRARIWVGQAFRKEPRSAWLLAVCEQRRQRHPFRVAAYKIPLEVYAEEEAWEKVLELTQALELLGHASPSSIRRQAFALSQLERYREAVLLLERLLEEDGSDAWALESLGNCHVSLDEYREALEMYRRCLALPLAELTRQRIRLLARQVEALLGPS